MAVYPFTLTVRKVYLSFHFSKHASGDNTKQHFVSYFVESH